MNHQNQNGQQNTDKMASLVLSIFKGENFVVKGYKTPVRVFIRAKCADLQPELALESGAVELTSVLTEPEFHSQLAWSLTRKQLKELRSNRSTIKVTCFISDGIPPEAEIGYVVLHVKDATAFGPGVDVDPTKAKTFPLLGTKDQWRTLQPKLQMVLHLEDIPPEKRPPENQTIVRHPAPQNVKQEVITVPTQREETEIKIKRDPEIAETKVLPSLGTDKFKWAVKGEYFQLGDSADDDMYILNITIISASFLHLLWDERSPRKRIPDSSDNYFWQIKYEAYGCEIASEPFPLAKEDLSRRTFIGDRATARIRANGILFFEYLQETTLQFFVIRYRVEGPEKELVDPRVMGCCFASLSELSNPNVKEHRICMEVMTEWGTPRVQAIQDKPEVRVVFGLEAIPNFFQLSVREGETNNNNNVVRPDLNPPIQRPNDQGSVSGNPDMKKEIVANQDAIDGDDRTTVDTDIEAISNTSNARRLLQFEGHTRQPSSSPTISSALTSPEKRVSGQRVGSNRQRSESSTSNSSESDDSDDDTSNKENLAKILPPPGEFKVTIELGRFWLKSRHKPIKGTFVLTYTHPPIGISDKPIQCCADPVNPEETDSRHGFLIQQGRYSKSVKISEFTESLLNEPLTVELYKNIQEGRQPNKSVASAMIPFGRVFLQKESNNCWIVEDSTDILKSTQNVKIGSLFYKIKVTRLLSHTEDSNKITVSNQRHSAFFPPSNSNAKKPSRTKTDGYTRDPNKMEKVTEDMREWRRTQEEILKRQKEETEAYLKIVSEEHAQREAERDSITTRKIAELEKKEKEFSRQRKVLDEKEESLNKLNAELQDKARKLALEKESLQQNTSLARQRLEETHKIEVEGLNRRIRGFQDENEKLKTKVLLLEKKLETKEAEIDNLTALKRELPDVRLEQRVSLLEQENKSLKNLLRESNAKKEQYKKQSYALCQKMSRMQQEKDHDLREQNDNLRLQILASKEHKELKKGRKAVLEISQQLKALQRETVPQSTDVGCGDRTQLSTFQNKNLGTKDAINTHSKKNDEEIARLTREREKLLQSGAYNNFDSVVRELEKRMITLAQEKA